MPNYSCLVHFLNKTSHSVSLLSGNFTGVSEFLLKLKGPGSLSASHFCLDKLRRVRVKVSLKRVARLAGSVRQPCPLSMKKGSGVGYTHPTSTPRELPVTAEWRRTATAGVSFTSEGKARRDVGFPTDQVNFTKSS